MDAEIEEEEEAPREPVEPFSLVREHLDISDSNLPSGATRDPLVNDYALAVYRHCYLVKHVT